MHVEVDILSEIAAANAAAVATLASHPAGLLRRPFDPLRGFNRTDRLAQEQSSAGHRPQPSLPHVAWPKPSPRRSTRRKRKTDAP
jgi:hypothetical protein